MQYWVLQLKLFILPCNFNSVLSISGITTYEYVRAHRVAQERQQQLHAERLAASISNQNADDKGRGYKNLSDNSNSSGSQLQWDRLERDHGPGSKQGERRCQSTCCQCPLPISFCNKNNSNIHPNYPFEILTFAVKRPLKHKIILFIVHLNSAIKLNVSAIETSINCCFSSQRI